MLCPPPAVFPRVESESPASQAVGRAGELHTQQGAGRGGAARREDLPPPLSNAPLRPDSDGTQRPSHSPRLSKLSWLSCGCRREARLRGRMLRPPSPVDLSPRGSRRESSLELQEAEVRRSAPERTDSPQPGQDLGPLRATGSTRRRRRLLFAARLCLGPGSYHGAWGCPEQALEPRCPTARGASGLRAA